jgi:hypothetical protein
MSIVLANGWPRSGNVVTMPILSRKSFVATAVAGAASERQGQTVNKRAIATQVPATERSFEEVIAW